MQDLQPNLLYTAEANAQCQCVLWRIERRDGEVFCFTNHNRKVTFNGEVYSPVDGVQDTAFRDGANFSGSSLELEGVLSSDRITDGDLLAGRFRDAQVDVFVVDWRWPFMGASHESRLWITSITHSALGWKAEIQGSESWLGLDAGDFYTRNCPFTLGDADCGYDVASKMAADGTAGVTVIDTDGRRWFTFSLAGSFPDGYFTKGAVEWLTGDNAGLHGEAAVVSVNGGTATVSLAESSRRPIRAGDTLNLAPGCQGRYVEDCVNKFAWGANFGGAPNMPGTDTYRRAPT